METYSKLIPGGYIQNYSFNPFKVHLMCGDQLLIFKNMKAKVLYFDATSSLVINIPNQKAVYLYSLVIHHPLQGRPAFPVTEMLSSSQFSSEITHFLSKFINFGHTMKTTCRPKRIVTDLSWALLQACSKAYNSMDMKSYIGFCFDIVNKKKHLKR